MWVYIYIYIYIYMDVYVCVSVCVHGWVTKEGSYLWHLWPTLECLEGPLCLLWHKDYTKSYARKNLRDWKRGQRKWSVGSETPEQRVSQEWDFKVVSWEWDSRAVCQKVKPRTQSSEDDDQMSQHFWWLYRILAEFSQ